MAPSTLSRKSIPLSLEELRLADRVRTPGTREREAVEAVVGALPERLSETQAIAQLLAVGEATIHEGVTHAGYAAYAASLEKEDEAFAEATRARRSERARRRAEAGRE